MRPYSRPRGGGRPFRGRGQGQGGGTWPNRRPSREQDSDHGDMKTGLFKASFLENPWEHLLSGKRKIETEEIGVGKGEGKEYEKEDGVAEDGDAEGEIELPDDDDQELEDKEKAE